MSNRPRSTGTVRWFNAYKGFGFVAPDDGGVDLFVHHASILYHGYRTLSEGQPVAFLLDYAQDGRTKAVDVTSLLRSRPSHATGRGSYSGRGRVGGYGDRYAGGNTHDDPYRYGWGGGIGRRGGGYGGSGRYSEGPECYNCGPMGHLARDCYQGAGGGTRRRGGGGRGRGGGGGGEGGACFHCGEEGHFARECPNIDK